MIWKQSMGNNYAPRWPCPTCKTGVLALEKGSLIAKETVASRQAVGHEDWDPDWIVYTFSCWLKCTVPSCGERVAVVGLGGEEPEWDAESGQIWERYYKPRFMWPMPDIIEIPAKCQEEVAAELRASFRAFWSDQNGAASHLRVALELLLDSIGVKSKSRDTKGKYSQLTLHRRLEVLQQRDALTGGNLMAVKWLGNTGSHESEVTVDDLLSAFSVMEHALDELVNERTRKVQALARALTKKHRRRK